MLNESAQKRGDVFWAQLPHAERDTPGRNRAGEFFPEP